MKYFQQGDVIITQVKEIPNGLKEIQNGGVLAEGEVTGHAHRVRMGDVKLFEGPDGAVGFMDAPQRIVLEHEEHKPIELPSGHYQINIVQEYDHFAEEARQVAD